MLQNIECLLDERVGGLPSRSRRSTNHPLIDICPDQGQKAAVINQARWQSRQSVTKCRQGVNFSTPCVHLEGEMSGHGCQGARA
jgi:hypothetical protein